MNEGGKMIPTKAKRQVVSNEYKERLKKFVKEVMKGTVFKIRDIDRIYDEVRGSEMNFILDLVSVYLSSQPSEAGARIREDKQFLLCEFVCCLVLFVHETFKYDGCLKHNKCIGGCLSLFVSRLRLQGMKTGFPIIRQFCKNIEKDNKICMVEGR